MFKKIAPKIAKSKKAKISKTKLNLETQNIHIKPLIKLYNTYNKRFFETVYLGKNVINLLQQKVAKKLPVTSSFQKIIMSLQK
jgi:hypothetical protein